MASTKPQDSSSSKRHFHWTKKIGSEEEQLPSQPSFLKSSSFSSDKKDHIEYLHNNSTNTIEKEKEKEKEKKKNQADPSSSSSSSPNHQTCSRRKLPQVAVARLRSVVLTALGRHRSSGLSNGLGTRVVGTLFGSRRGHVHFAFQKDPNSEPAFLIELATPISGLVKEMASGLVRIALECGKEKSDAVNKRLLEENSWRTYCNGKKCGFATRRDCGPRDWKILRAVEPISMGAGVLPPGGGEIGDDDDDDDGGGGGGGHELDEVMYMRAKFERIVGSRDSEAFYMMNPDSNGAPELSIYLLRV